MQTCISQNVCRLAFIGIHFSFRLNFFAALPFSSTAKHLTLPILILMPAQHCESKVFLMPAQHSEGTVFLMPAQH